MPIYRITSRDNNRGKLYVKVTDAKNMYPKSIKRAAAQMLAAKTSEKVDVVYHRLVKMVLKNGTNVYMLV